VRVSLQENAVATNSVNAQVCASGTSREGLIEPRQADGQQQAHLSRMDGATLAIVRRR
jgi:hypothetical protein